MSTLVWVAASTRARHTQLGRQAGLQGLIPSCQQTHDSGSDARGGSPACCGPALRSGRGRLLRVHRCGQGGGSDFCCFRKWGPLQSAREGRPNSACRLAPLLWGWQGARPLPLPGLGGLPLQTAPFVWSWRQKERKRSSGCEQKGLLRRRKRGRSFSLSFPESKDDKKSTAQA